MSDKYIKINNRINYIDFLRAYGILVMIMGHVGFGNIFDKWIHAFHMPMFFIVSGYFYRAKPLGSLVFRRIRTILLPYVFFGTIACIIYFIDIQSVDYTVFRLLFWENTADNGVPLAGAIWFLSAIFISDVLYCTIASFIHEIKILNIVVAFVSFLGMVFATYLPFRLPFATDVGMVGVGFIHTGRLLKEKGGRLLELKLSEAVLGCFIFSALGFVNSYVNLRNGRYGIWPLFWINAVCLTVCFWNISKHIYEWFSKKNSFAGIKMFILSMGEDSIVFLCLNQLIIHYLRMCLNRLIPATSFSFFAIVIKRVITLYGTICLLALARIIFTKTKLRVLIGR